MSQGNEYGAGSRGYSYKCNCKQPLAPPHCLVICSYTDKLRLIGIYCLSCIKLVNICRGCGLTQRTHSVAVLEYWTLTTYPTLRSLVQADADTSNEQPGSLWKKNRCFSIRLNIWLENISFKPFLGFDNFCFPPAVFSKWGLFLCFY